MFFIGVITNKKNESYLKKELKSIIPTDNIFIINDGNIENIKNIKFEIVIIDKQINNKLELRNILSKSKYIILNSDIEMNVEAINNLKLIAITYGFNSKCTFTVSSITENNIIICLQRIIYNKNNEVVEPQEFKLEVPENVEKQKAIFVYIIKILYSKIK